MMNDGNILKYFRIVEQLSTKKLATNICVYVYIYIIFGLSSELRGGLTEEREKDRKRNTTGFRFHRCSTVLSRDRHFELGLLKQHVLRLFYEAANTTSGRPRGFSERREIRV